MLRETDSSDLRLIPSCSGSAASPVTRYVPAPEPLPLGSSQYCRAVGGVGCAGTSRTDLYREICVGFILGKLLLRKLPSIKRHPLYKATMLVTSFKGSAQNSRNSSVLFSVLCFFTFSAKIVYISLLCIACRLFSRSKGPVAEKGLII